MVVHNTLKVGQEKLCPIIKRQMVSFKQNKTKWMLKDEKYHSQKGKSINKSFETTFGYELF